MKKVITLLSLCFLAISLIGQDTKWPPVDKSPLDAIYYPQKAAWRNYLSGDDRNLSLQMQINYSRPQKKGREVFGNLVPYGKEWRLGANQATELVLYQAVNFGGTVIPRGAYTMFATPEKDSWTISISSQKYIWGAHKRDQSLTVASVKAKVVNVDDAREALSMAFQKVDDQNANLVIEWDQTRAVVPINLYPANFTDIDVSPMDEAMYPVSANGLNYLPADQHDANQPMIRIRYSRPQKKGRDIFGVLLKYGDVWRVGANESTELRIYKDVNIGGVDVSAGAYNLYAVVHKDSWDIILNTERPAWGAANRDESKDIATFTIPVKTEKEVVEALSIIYEDQDDGSTHIIIAWDQTRARIPVVFKN